MITRIIPRLDIKGPNLVKGIHLEGLRTLGKPELFARHYYEQGADELIFMDVVASLYERNSLSEFIEKTAKQIFIPLTVGGGIRTLDDITRVLDAGADKIAINTAAVRNSEFVRQAALRFGSSTIVVSIEVMKKEDGSYEALTDNGREETGLDAYDWAQQVAGLGAGELMITSIDQEGTGNGFDNVFIKKVSQSVSIPVIASGGAGCLDHIRNVIVEGDANAVCLASMLHYDVIHNLDMLDQDYSAEGNIEYLKNKKNFSKITPASISEIKTFLINNKNPCRPIDEDLYECCEN